MEAVIFCGTQATGKSSFYKLRFDVRNSSDYLVALTSRGYHESDRSSAGTRVDPKIEWIQDVATFMTPRLRCTLTRDHRFPQEVDFHACAER